MLNNDYILYAESDLMPGLGTFMACLILPLEIGLLIGIGINVILILYHAARPKVVVEVLKSSAGIDYMMITPDRCLIFPSAEYIRNLVNDHCLRHHEYPVVIDGSHIYAADFTVANVIKSLLNDFKNRNQLILFYNLKSSVYFLLESLSTSPLVVYYEKEQLDKLLQTHCKPNSIE